MSTITTAEAPTTPAKKATRLKAHTEAWTPARRSAIEGYLSCLQAAMRLQDWTISVEWDKPCGKDALATVTPMGDSRHAYVRLSPEFLNEPVRMRSQVLIHELTHCHLFALDHIARETVSLTAGKKAAAVFDIAFTSHLEMTVDAIADALVDLLPPLTLN